MHSERLWNFLAHLVLAIFSIIIVLPLAWTVRTSLAPEILAYEIPPKMFFRPTLNNYLSIFRENKFHVHFLNSVLVSLAVTFLSITLASFSGYALAKYKTGGNVTKFLILSTQMLPPIVLVIPLFLIFLRLNLVNTRTGLVISYLAFNLPFLTWILMGFFESVPRELEEAALIDGANRLISFLKIVLPIASPGILAAAILSFIMCWNEFLFALILTGAETSTVPVALAALQTQRGVLIGKLSAGVILGITPIVLMSFFIQKYLIRGLSFGALK